jgi:hypothetical protein
MYCIRKHLAIVIARGRLVRTLYLDYMESESRDGEITPERQGPSHQCSGLSFFPGCGIGKKLQESR